jgi:hypothetical protein
MNMIECISERGSQENLLLVGKDDSITSGDVVLVKGTTWDIEVDNKKWTVGVEWKIEK